MGLFILIWYGCHVNTKHAVSHQIMSSVMSYWTWIPAAEQHNIQNVMFWGRNASPVECHISLMTLLLEVKAGEWHSFVLSGPIEGMSRQLHILINKLLGTLFYTITVYKQLVLVKHSVQKTCYLVM